jgi:hypothetical protein
MDEKSEEGIGEKAQQRADDLGPPEERNATGIVEAGLAQARPIARHSGIVLGDDVPTDLLDGPLQPRLGLALESKNRHRSSGGGRGGEPAATDRRPESQDDQGAEHGHPDHHEEGDGRDGEWVHGLIP